jgi:hypothetical protein
LREFSKDFERATETQCAEKPRTIEFQLSRVKQLLKAEFADRPLKVVDKASAEKYRRTRAAKVSRLGRPPSIANWRLLAVDAACLRVEGD